MNMPPEDNRNTPKSNFRSSNSKTTKKRNALVRIAFPIALVLIGIALLAAVGLHIVNISFGGVSVQERPISDILNMADAHKLASVTLNGNEVTATTKTGQKYHAIKEDR